MQKRAFVIDDDEFVRETLKAMLEFLDFEVVTAEDGRKAIEVFASQISSKNFFDVVFVDLIMPEMSGMKVIQELKRIDPNINAVISSGYFNDPSVAEYEKLGFKGILNKPYTLEELKETLKKLNIL
ncbi:MAG: response regulator [Thermodesulfovibrio sp.]|nr:response regulator [Thermodesulfovibrio sp.]MCX7724908.1 response regulator [Thermodesulfovibrio sp.]MDW7972314.1 response regulator [Thermodesulfovibrio sp.]